MRPSALFALAGLLTALSLTPAAAAAPPADSWTGEDKLLHFSASALLAGLAYGTASLFVEPRPTRAAIGASTALSFGIGKEVYDMTGRGTPSVRDLAWDVMGTGVGTGLALGIGLLLGRATTHSAGSSGLVIAF